MTAAQIDLPAIRDRLGGVISRNGTRLSCPGPAHTRKDRSLQIDLTGDPAKPFLLWSYAGDGYVECCRHAGLPLGTGSRDDGLPNPERERQRRERERLHALERRRRAEFCAAVWHETQDAEGTVVERYLAGRGIIGPIPAALRFHPAAPLDYEREGVAPAMVALVRDHNGRTSGLHVTALKPDGSGKAPGDNPRRMFGEIAGGAVRLAPLGHKLGICEGIETALAFQALTGTPTWAALSASNLSRWLPPSGVERVVIGADNDKPGMRAAELLMENARPTCQVMNAPAPDGSDWADVLKAGVTT
jgi:phage/plasmid primase-like uncharacterized protein